MERLKKIYGGTWLNEDGAKHQIQFAIMNDTATIYIDTSGVGLHKRGYRAIGNAAPLRETLAAAMVMLSHYRGKESFFDPLCGSGTIAIEAAFIAKNKAPGIGRHFAAEHWTSFPSRIWRQAREEAREKEFNGSYSILGSDIDPISIDIARSNAKKAGVDKLLRFEVANAINFSSNASKGIIVTNPPYGERLMEQNEAAELYRQLGKVFLSLSDFELYIISSHPEFEHFFGRKANKKRKLYNGMIKCDLFMYLNK